MMNNPWLNMKPSTRRRIISNAKNDLFWIIDVEGKYGFYISSVSLTKDKIETIKLKGVSILRRANNDRQELVLILNKKEDWQLFLTLCNDLISLTNINNEDALFLAIENRLKRWQVFLKSNNKIDFSLQKQMGLFSELDFLLNILTPQIGIENAIESWVGADFDKQDFLLEKVIVEVKSAKTSKKKAVVISSANQLFSDKQPIYLVAYSLTPNNDRGVTLDQIIEEILLLLQKISVDRIYEFENKIFSYGYIKSIDIKKYKFIIDKIETYIVSDDFPKIIPSYINSAIIKLKYDIDLNQCKAFIIDNPNYK